MTFRRFKKASKKVIQVNQEKIRNGKAAFSKGFKEVTLCNTCDDVCTLKQIQISKVSLTDFWFYDMISACVNNFVKTFGQ